MPMKILVADDSRVSRNLLRPILEELDFEVLVAENGREAWDIFQREEISLLLTDWEMPELKPVLGTCPACAGKAGRQNPLPRALTPRYRPALS